MVNEEILLQLNSLQQEANQIAEQIELIDKNTIEIQKLRFGIEELKEAEKKEALANIGKGIYIPVEIKNDKLKIEIGKGILVEKTIDDTIKLINEQVKKLEQEKQILIRRIKDVQKEINNSIEKIKEKE